MKASVREFKARLSMYLQKADNGEDVIITSRGRPVARLLALATAASPEPAASELERRLKRIPGMLAARDGKPRGSSHPIIIGRGQKTVAELVLQERG
ncbi:MAG: type II toxin-antitoxin system prevent-host-death family antitoxin [Candidatus Binatus sp.]|jgi:prevent-host-death family protein|uniref:type II toxin-antitoxin system Phd/YefM family antitoxin n=1 Tax=Candidatus Binatus sp. TaxID=2811406 RepID=UPI003C8F3893